MTVKELIDVLDCTTNIIFSTDNDIFAKPLYEYPYLRVKNILDGVVKTVEVRWLEHLDKAILYVEVAK